MPSRYLATVQCPSCGTRFQTPVEQILDVRVDPSVRSRLLRGAVNMVVCPRCGTAAALNLPFIYHDPEKEVALLYLPVETGANEVERQKVAGRLTRQLMDAMPVEERKGYLLQPETFINLETLIKRVLELEGISEEDLARNQRQQELVAKLLEAEKEDWPQLLAENAELVDEGIFAFLEYVLQLASASGQDTEKLEALRDYLVEETELGRRLARRTEVLRQFADQPSQESLLEALTDAPDDETVEMLVQSGLPLMDYRFFQQLVSKIEAASSTEERERLQALRRRILDLRDQLVRAGEERLSERARLLTRLVASEDPYRLASSHLSELDDLFFMVLGAQLREAQDRGDSEAMKALQRLAEAVERVIESTMPPEVALARRLMAATSDEELQAVLDANRGKLTPEFLQFLETLEQSLREQGQEDGAERLAKIRARAQGIVSSAEAAPSQPETPISKGDSEERTPSGLIIARH